MKYLIVEFERLKYSDLPTSLLAYQQWARDYNYLVIVEDNIVHCYNKFTNERDAKLYALSHDKEVKTHLEDWY